MGVFLRHTALAHVSVMGAGLKNPAPITETHTALSERKIRPITRRGINREGNSFAAVEAQAVFQRVFQAHK